MREELTPKDILESAIEPIQESVEKQPTMDRVAAGADIAKPNLFAESLNKR